MDRTVRASKIAEYLRSVGHKAEVKLNPEAEASTVAHYTAGPGPHLSWISSKVMDVIFRGSILLVESATLLTSRADTGIVVVSGARLAFALVATKFFSHIDSVAGRHLVGKRCLIHRTAEIGCDGQGFAWDDAAECYVRMPHFYAVIIEDDVEVGPYATICRGVLNNTVIGAGSKIGNHVNIGHGTRVGKHCIIVAHATVGGSVTIGDHVKIWQGAMIRNGVTIGDGADIGMGSIVTCDVRPGEVVRRFTE